ncbi:hypothetical protein SHIRM173S_01042 [Streptomyces hirsutus]
MKVNRTSLPRSPVNNWSGGVSAKASTAACRSKTRASLSPARTCSMRLPSISAVPLVASGTPVICTPRVTQVIHTTPRTRVVRAAVGRWRTIRFVIRTAASVISTSRAANRTITPITARICPPRPNDSRTNSAASSNRIQSSTRSNGRASTW